MNTTKNKIEQHRHKDHMGEDQASDGPGKVRVRKGIRAIYA